MIVHAAHNLSAPLAALLGSVTASGPPTLSREERLWIERARAGDEAGYRRLLECYRGRILRLCRATLGSSVDAEDAAQEAFIRAFRSLGQYQASGSFYAWLCRIAVRACTDRKRLRSAPALQCAWMDESAGNSEDKSDAVQTAIVVRDLLARLSPPMRAALALRELDGLEYEEIAVVLNVPVGTVRSRLNAARAQFRVLWEAAMREEPEA